MTKEEILNNIQEWVDDGKLEDEEYQDALFEFMKERTAIVVLRDSEFKTGMCAYGKTANIILSLVTTMKQHKDFAYIIKRANDMYTDELLSF